MRMEREKLFWPPTWKILEDDEKLHPLLLAGEGNLGNFQKIVMFKSHKIAKFVGTLPRAE